MVRGGLTANLKLVIDPKASPDFENAANNFMQNQAIDSYTDKSEIYIPSGDNFRTLLGNSAEAVKQFISEDAVIALMRICLLYLCLWMLLVKLERKTCLN
jgi:hypothetical protein